jgi:hypothetical protein
MPIDPYAACPGGTGKKIKFCCQDLVGDLEQLDRLLEGEQVTAALEQVERLLARTPGRACLLATRTKLQLGTRKFAEAAAGSAEFLSAFPENPLALGQAAVTEAITGHGQEAAALFDRAREAAGAEIGPELERIAATLVQVSAQTGQTGFAQGIIEWLADAGIGTAEDRHMLASVVGSAGVPAALRARVPFEACPDDSPWRFEFDIGLKAAREWRLGKALTTFRSLKKVAGQSPELFTNLGRVCELLGLPFEAAEAWSTVARLRASDRDAALEAVGRAMALETEADQDRSPVIRYVRASGMLAAADASADGLDLLEDRFRKDGRFEPGPFDRSEWVSRGAVPPRSVWRIYDAGIDSPAPGRLLATLLVFGRQTDREAELVIQGFEPDLQQAEGIVGPITKVAFTRLPDSGRLPVATPTTWLISTQFRMVPPAVSAAGTPADEPGALDILLDAQREQLWKRFHELWPDTPLPELLGKSPRGALLDTDGARRVEALLVEGEATSRRRDANVAWGAMRKTLGLEPQTAVTSAKPIEEVPPMRWHRVVLDGLEIGEIRGLFLMAVDAGFDLAGERAARAILARTDVAPEDRWEALSFLEERALGSVEKLSIITQLRGIAAEMKANDGMIDVAELRVRLQRGDQADTVRLLEHMRRDHSRDARIMESLAEVLMEAGIDLPGLASARAGGGAPGGSSPATLGSAGGPGMAGTAPAAAPASGGLWTPGGSPAAPQQGEKKTIWTPGS